MNQHSIHLPPGGRDEYRTSRSGRLRSRVLRRCIVDGGDENRTLRRSVAGEAVCDSFGDEAGGVSGQGHRKRRFLHYNLPLGTFM